MAIACLDADNWIDGRDHCLSVQNPSWDQVECAILALDDGQHSMVILALDGSEERHMSIFGRSGDRCMVYATEDNRDFHSLLDERQSEGTVEVNVGGQVGDYELKKLVPFAWAIEAARTYYETGNRKGGLNWASDY